MGMTPQHLHTIPTSCAILPTMHITCTLAYSHSLNDYTALLTPHPSVCMTTHICHVCHAQ